MEKEFCGQTGGQADINGSIRGPRGPKIAEPDRFNRLKS